MEKNVGTGLPDSPTAKRHKKRRTVGDAGPYQEEERHKRTVGDAGPCKDVPHFRFPVIPTKAQPRGGIRSLLLGKRILRLRYAPLRMTKRWNRVPFSVSLRGRRPHPRVASLAPLGQFTSWQSPGARSVSTVQFGGSYRGIATSALPPRNDNLFVTFPVDRFGVVPEG